MCTCRATDVELKKIDKILRRKGDTFLCYKIVDNSNGQHKRYVLSEFGIGKTYYDKGSITKAAHDVSNRSSMEFDKGIHVLLNLKDARAYKRRSISVQGESRSIAIFKVKKSDILYKARVNVGGLCVPCLLMDSVMYTGRLVTRKKK